MRYFLASIILAVLGLMLAVIDLTTTSTSPVLSFAPTCTALAGLSTVLGVRRSNSGE